VIRDSKNIRGKSNFGYELILLFHQVLLAPEAWKEINLGKTLGEEIAVS
jgi:hypothetical protein